MTEPQNVSGLIDQIHDLKTQLTDAEKRANERKWECDNLHVGVYTWDEAVAALAGAGVAAELEERGLPGAIEALAQQRDEAEKRGAAKALRAEMAYFVSASMSAVLNESTRRTAEAAAAHLRSMADRIESGEATL